MALNLGPPAQTTMIHKMEEKGQKREKRGELENAAITVVLPRAASRCARTRSLSRGLLALSPTPLHSLVLARPLVG